MYKFNFTTITPLHISNGEVLDQNFHYLVSGDDIYKIDFFKLSALLAKEENIDFTREVSIAEIGRWIRKHQIKIIDTASAYSIKVNHIFRSHLNNRNADGRRQIIEFINSNGKFYVPASTIKGALLTPLGLHFLGINPNDAKIKDRVVFADSDYIDSNKFSVYRTESRPPENNMICLDPNVTFSLMMKRKGKFDKEFFLSSLKSYTEKQLENLQKEVAKFKSKKTGKLRKADLFLRSIESIVTLSLKGETIINIGFGGGSWFKIIKGEIPKFNSKIPARKNIKEPAHSTFSFSVNRELVHIGWCKLEIEEL